MAFNWLLPVRIVQAVLIIIVLGLNSYVANWWSGFWHSMSPSEVNFLIFTSVWSILALAYLIVVPWKFTDHPAAHKFGILAVEGVTMIFWFAGFVALAVFLSDRVCFGHVCAAAKAGDVFAAFAWVSFAASTALAVIHVVKSRNQHKSGPPPQMSQEQGV